MALSRDSIKRIAAELVRGRQQQSDKVVNESFGGSPPPGVIPTSPEEMLKKIEGKWEPSFHISNRRDGGAEAPVPDPPTLEDLARVGPRRKSPIAPIPFPEVPPQLEEEEPTGSPTDQYINLIDSEEERDCIRESMDILFGKDEDEL